MVVHAGCCNYGTIAAGGGSVWFASDDGTVLRLDARTAQIVWRRHGFGFSLTSTVGNGSVWLGSASANGAHVFAAPDSGGAITPIEISTNGAGPAVAVGGAPTGIAIVGASIFVSDIQGVVHPYIGGSVLPAIRVGGQATGIAFGEGSLWVSVSGT